VIAGVGPHSVTDRHFILDEIRRTAAENGGIPLGRDAFLTATGIKQTDWYGRFWARWGDAIREAGFAPNQMQGAFAEDDLLGKVAWLVRELGHFPVEGELRLKNRSDKSFPSHSTLARLGSKQKLAARLVEYCERVGGLEDVAALCVGRSRSPARREAEEAKAPAPNGFVYMLRSGRSYKIGKTNAVGRRERELAIQLPEKANTVHVISTDDPAGIEAYWHRRFDAKRKNGEWFELTAAAVAAFKRRKFM